jgi:hypothetical protein
MPFSELYHKSQENMLRKFVLLVVLAMGMLVQTSPAPVRALYLESAGFTPTSLPAGAVPIRPINQADLNQDGTTENLSLAHARLTIFSSGRSVWQSPPGWEVIQAEITDLNQDGAAEATLLVWRPFRPWPVDQWLPYGGRIDHFQDGEGNSCSIILIGWRGNGYGELWAGSALAEPIKSFAAADLNGDNTQELVTLEGRYADSRLAPGRGLKAWEWNGFGFTSVSSMKGTFDKFVVAQNNAGRLVILVP